MNSLAHGPLRGSGQRFSGRKPSPRTELPAPPEAHASGLREFETARCKARTACAPRPSASHVGAAAFTLLEVTLAMALLFSITFVLLQITSTNLKIAKVLQRTTIDASSLAAELSLTNRLEEGVESGDFGDLYPNHHWQREITMVGTNGLFECRFEVLAGRNGKPESELVVLLFRPDSTRGGASGRLGTR